MEARKRGMFPLPIFLVFAIRVGGGGGDTFCNGFLGEVKGVPFSGWRYIMG